ncbi:MAG: phosphatidate cytidylyltransferase [Chloroflexota bacterium]|nr:phosphatidate cytidylyltransferase [Chloroflexota bacterium]
MNSTLHPQDSATQARKLTNLQQRWLTALTLGPLMLLLMGVGGWWFMALALLLAVIGVLEFCHLGRNRGVHARAWVAAAGAVALVLASAIEQTPLWLPIFATALLLAWLWSLLARRGVRTSMIDALMTTAALGYVGLPAALLVQVRAAPDGLIWLLLIILLTWGTDTLAYFGGKTWGKTLLAPRISPKKTVEGALTGIVGGVVVALVFLALAGKLTVILLPLVLIAPVVAVIGDLSESALKRAFAVKDSHLSHFNLFPGHGGVLDRTDALILVTWLCYAGYTLLGII